MYYTHKRIILNDLDKITSGKLSLIAVCVCVGWCVCLCSFGRIGEFASPLFSLQHSRRYIRLYARTVVHGMCLWSAVLGQTIKKKRRNWSSKYTILSDQIKWNMLRVFGFHCGR